MQDAAAQPAALSLAVVNRALRVLAGVTIEGGPVDPKPLGDVGYADRADREHRRIQVQRSLGFIRAHRGLHPTDRGSAGLHLTRDRRGALTIT